MKTKKKGHSRKTRARAKKVLQPPSFPLMNPYADLRASTVSYTPEGMVSKDKLENIAELEGALGKRPSSNSTPSPSFPPNYIPSNPPGRRPDSDMISGETSRSFTGSNVPPTNRGQGKMCVLADDPNCAGGSSALDQFNAYAAKYGAEAACAYFAKNPAFGAVIAPFCGQIGSFVGQYIAEPLKKAETGYLSWDGKMNQWVHEGVMKAVDWVKDAAHDSYCGAAKAFTFGLYTPSGCD